MGILCLSCSKNEGDAGMVRLKVSLEPMLPTRPANAKTFASSFDRNGESETEEAIGIFAVKSKPGQAPVFPASGDNYAQNVKWIRNPLGEWVPASTADRIDYPSDGSALSFFAYYPYDPSFTDPTAIVFTVRADQSDTHDFVNSNLMTAQCLGAISGDIVFLQFTHRLAFIKLEVVSGAVKLNESLSGVLLGCIPSVTLDLGKGVAALTGNPSPIGMWRSEEDVTDMGTFIFRALIPAQVLAKGTKLCEFILNGRPYSYFLPEDQDFTFNKELFIEGITLSN